MRLEDLLELGIMDHIDTIEEISERATRELALETAKRIMEREWDDIKFQLAPYKETGVSIMINNEPIWELIDEQIMKSISMCGSPYIEFMEKEMQNWKNGLLKL